MSFEKYCEQHFYRPMGLPTIGFKPIMRFSLEKKLPPTERDTTFGSNLSTVTFTIRQQQC